MSFSNKGACHPHIYVSLLNTAHKFEYHSHLLIHLYFYIYISIYLWNLYFIFSPTKSNCSAFVVEENRCYKQNEGYWHFLSVFLDVNPSSSVCLILPGTLQHLLNNGALLPFLKELFWLIIEITKGMLRKTCSSFPKTFPKIGFLEFSYSPQLLYNSLLSHCSEFPLSILLWWFGTQKARCSDWI